MDENETSFLLSRGIQVLSLISNNGYSQIFTASSDRYPNGIALKRIIATKVNFDVLQRLNTMDDSKIVTVHEFIRFNQFVFIVMEYCRYDIEKFIRNGLKVETTDLSRYIKLTIEAVISCHIFSIFGLNIKPSNFLIDQFGRLKISDFYYLPEIRTHYNSQTITQINRYSAPEILHRIEMGNEKSDVWSLGATIYYMATGKSPFNNQDSLELINTINRADYDKDQIFDPFLKEVISYCLQPNPLNRKMLSELLNCDYFKQADKSLTACSSFSKNSFVIPNLSLIHI